MKRIERKVTIEQLAIDALLAKNPEAFSLREEALRNPRKIVTIIELVPEETPTKTKKVYVDSDSGKRTPLEVKHLVERNRELAAKPQPAGRKLTEAEIRKLYGQPVHKDADGEGYIVR